MNDIEATSRQLADVIKRYSADYIEAHLEESQRSYITYRGRELESIGQATAIGGNIRALIRGGWGFVSFNESGDLPGKVELAVKQAILVGREESKLAPLEPIVDTVSTAHNPTTKPLAEKKQLLDEYNELIWHTPKLQSSVINYSDSHKKIIFLSSAGSHIVQERSDINLRLRRSPPRTARCNRRD